MAEFEMRAGWWKTRSGEHVLIYRRRSGTMSKFPWDGVRLLPGDDCGFTKVFCWSGFGHFEIAGCGDPDPLDLMQFVERLFIPDFPPADVIDGPGIYEDDNDGSEWKIIGRTADTNLWIGVCGVRGIGLFYSSGEFHGYTVCSQDITLPNNPVIKKMAAITFQDV